MVLPAVGTELKELPLGETSHDETLKAFDGSWAHSPNFTRAFFEENSSAVVGVGYHPRKGTQLRASTPKGGLVVQWRQECLDMSRR
jgi:hypothetical protein